MNKIQQEIELINMVSDITNEKNNKSFSSSQLKNLNKILIKEDIDELIFYILKNDINLSPIIPFNYRNLKLYSTNNELNIKKLNDYKFFKASLEKIITDKDFLYKFCENSYKNQSRKKGNEFKKIIQYSLMKDVNSFYLPLCFDISETKNIDEYIFIPSLDSQIKEILNIKINKGRDILIKYKEKYFIGEVKSIGENGGSQNNQFQDMLNCLNEFNTTNVFGFGLIYGPCLFTKNVFKDKIKTNDRIFLLSDFIFNFDKTLQQLYSLSEKKLL